MSGKSAIRASHWRSASFNGQEPAPELMREYAGSMLAKQEQEHRLFHEVMADARNSNTPLGDIGLAAAGLSLPAAALARNPALEKRVPSSEDTWHQDLDSEGNPAWISLTLPERPEPEDSLTPDSSFFEQTQKAQADKKQPKKDKGKDSPEREAPPKGLQGVVRFLFERGTPRAGKHGQEARPNKPPSTARSVLRMFLMGAALAIIYHILTFFAIIPPIF